MGCKFPIYSSEIIFIFSSVLVIIIVPDSLYSAKPHFKSVLLPPIMSSSSNRESRPLPRFGQWDERNPASFNEFTVIFEKARDERKTSGAAGSEILTPDRSESLQKYNGYEEKTSKFKNLKKKWFCCG
ncbi:hypothetical protein SLE2022_378760 [Rubroshorea leprosula]